MISANAERKFCVAMQIKMGAQMGAYYAELLPLILCYIVYIH